MEIKLKRVEINCCFDKISCVWLGNVKHVSFLLWGWTLVQCCLLWKWVRATNCLINCRNSSKNPYIHRCRTHELYLHLLLKTTVQGATKKDNGQTKPDKAIAERELSLLVKPAQIKAQIESELACLSLCQSNILYW